MATQNTGQKSEEAGAAGGEAEKTAKPEASVQADAAKASQAPTAEKTAAEPKAGAAEAKDAIALLKADHRKAEALFDQFEKASDDRQKADIARQVCAELIIHTIIEEEIFYPALEGQAEDKVDEAQVEHDSAKMLITELAEGGEGDDYRDAKMSVLAEQIRHHIKEEEGAVGLFAKARSAKLDLVAMGERLTRRKQELQRDEQAGRLALSEVVSFHHQPSPPRSTRFQQEDYMPRNSQDRDRDDRGRFTSDDDDRGGGRSSRGGDNDRGGRGHGGWYGDSEGHARAARERDDDRGGGGGGRSGGRGEERSYGRGRDDDDRGGRGGGRGQGGWFGDSEGHAEAARRGWDNPNHGDSGWYGDSRGHSEASRRGWENPNHGDSGWYGDSRGHSEAARRGWDNPDHGRSGWFGDSQGHSEASREGWEIRGGSRGGGGGRGRDDDDRGRYASRGRDDDDDRGDRGGGGRGGGNRGQGGWFGDSEGHSEASRRGWDRR